MHENMLQVVAPFSLPSKPPSPAPLTMLPQKCLNKVDTVDSKGSILNQRTSKQVLCVWEQGGDLERRWQLGDKRG